MTKIEFYIGGADKFIAVLDSDAVPRQGEAVNIRKTSYRVSRVAWALDYPDDRTNARLRACVELEKA